MSEWWTYRPSDFLMFSPRIYWRLFESLNLAAWPAQPLIVGMVLAWLGWGARQVGTFGAAAARVALFGLAWAWLAVAWLYFAQRYAPINWAAAYATPAFALQALGMLALALWGGVRGHGEARRRYPGLVLLGWALLVHPLLALGFVALLPYTKLRHILTTSANYIFADHGPKGGLVTLDMEDEEAESFGVASLGDLTWKDIFDGDACTLCKRCQDRCPAFATDKPLSPMKMTLVKPCARRLRATSSSIAW